MINRFRREVYQSFEQRADVGSVLPFLLTLGSPASPPQPAGKGAGRPLGYRPEPRKRHPVVKKSKKTAQNRLIPIALLLFSVVNVRTIRGSLYSSCTRIRTAL